MTNTLWSASQLEELSIRMARGEKAMQIAAEMHKPHVSVRHRMRWSKLTTQQKKDRARIARAKRLQRDAEASARDYRAFTTRRPTAEMLAERDLVYYETSRSITATLLGDPPRGRSALDRRSSV